MYWVLNSRRYSQRPDTNCHLLSASIRWLTGIAEASLQIIPKPVLSFRINIRMGKMVRTRSLALFVLLAGLPLAGRPAAAVEMKPVTNSAFEHYIALTEDRMAADDKKDNFLVIDKLSPDARQKAYAELRQGKLFVEQVHVKDDGRSVPIPEGLTHDWVGIVFIPGANLVETLALLQDADHYQDIYQPAVRRSHLVSWGENQLKISEQFYHKTIVTIAVNTDFDAHYKFMDQEHLVCWAHSTRAAEVEHVGQSDERELAPGDGHGYLWRMNTYWHIEQKDGGVYLQVETIALTRNVPVALEWVVAPLVKSIPRGTMTGFLTTTRTTITKKHTEKSATAAPSNADSRVASASHQ